jgi:hypothetical protein
MQAALQGGAATSRPTPSSTNRSIARSGVDGRHVPIQRKLVEKRCLIDLPLAHHDFIPGSDA